MKVVWTAQAERDRIDVWDYIVADDPGAAVRMDELFSGSAARLGDHPELGRVGRVPGTREWIPHESYCIVYEIDGDTVWILALVHTAGLWPPERE